MHKTWLIIRREYLSRVKKKSFIVITLLIPLLIAGFIALEAFLITGGNKQVLHVAVIDRSGLFKDNLTDGQQIFFSFVDAPDLQSLESQQSADGYDGVLVIPAIQLDHPTGFAYYSAHQLGLGPYEYITGQLNKVIQNRRMIEAGIDKDKLDQMKSDVSLIQPGISAPKGVDTAHITYAATVIGYIAGIFIYFILFFYGMQVMRGVAEEKTNRIAEVLASSVRPFQMMIGKVVGIAGVGLTQFLIWVILAVAAILVIGATVPGLSAHAGQWSEIGQMGTAANPQVAEAMQKAQNLMAALPITRIVLCFLFYFLGGYLFYAALFAAVGSAVDQEMTESQALTVPITLPLVISFFIMFNAIQQPNSPLSVFASIFPLSSPLVMIARVPFGVPGWQLALSAVLLILGIVCTIWLAGRIYRTGILLYGKKVTLKELAKWAVRKG
jgi:ABC-2 type transport system permease protein